MSITIVCGAPGSHFTTVFSLLEAQGLGQPKAAGKGRELSMADLHQRLLRARQPGSPIEVGKAWEQAAGDILLANWDQAHWGWADSRSVWLLDFWYGFDPDIKFVLVHSHPQQALAQYMEQVDQAEQVLSGLEIWEEYERAMLHFYHRHRDRCMLVDATEVLANPSDFLRYCKDWLGLPDLSSATMIMPSVVPVSAVDGWLAAQLLEGYPHIESLRQEVDASLSWTVAAAEPTPQGLDEALASLIEGRKAREQLKGRLSEVNAELHSQFQQNLSLKAAAEKREEQYERAREEVESARKDWLARFEQSQKKYDELKAAAEKREEEYEQARKDVESDRKDWLARFGQSQKKYDELKAAAEKREEEYEQARKDVESDRKDLLARLDKSQKKYDELSESYKQQQLRSENERVTLERTLEEKSKANEAAIRQQTAENELLILQLHQVQEEMEIYFLKAQEHEQKLEAVWREKAQIESQLTALQQSNKDLSQQHEAAIRQKAEDHEQKLEAVWREKARIESQLTALQQSNKDLSQQHEAAIRQKAEDHEQKLEAVWREKARIESQLTALQQRNQDLSQQHKAAIRQKAEDYEQKLEAVWREKARIESQLTALQQRNKDLSQQHETAIRHQTDENELLLLKLHQVQEELQHYFLGNRERDEVISGLNARWERVLRREPDLCDWSAVDLIKITHQPPNHLMRWRIRDVSIGKRVIPEMEIAVMVRESVPSLVYFRDAEKLTQGPLQRWPASFSDKDKLLIQPEGPQDTQLERSRAIAALSPADWQMTRTLCHLLVSPAVMAIAGAAGIDEDGQQFWQTALKRLRQQLDACPKVWRYGTVSLKHAFSNVDYEHLWLTLDEAEYENRHWHPFQFRLGAIDLQRGGFSAHPKLEFPKQEGGLQQFEGWYPESRDDFGDKFELRLDLARAVLDEQVWNRLSPADKTQMFMLAATLADMVRAIPQSQRNFARPIEHWIRFAEATLRVIEQQMIREFSPPAAKPPAAKTPAAEPQRSLPEPAATVAVEPVGNQESVAQMATTPSKVAGKTASAPRAARTPAMSPEIPTAAQRLDNGSKAPSNPASRQKSKAKKGRKG